MVHLRLRNPIPEFPQKPRVEPNTERKVQVADKATQKILSTPDPHAYRSHPLAKTKVITIEMEYDQDAESFVTFVKELRRMSSFGETESEALDNTAEMIRGYIKSMEANRKKIPLAAAKLSELKRLVGFPLSIGWR